MNSFPFVFPPQLFDLRSTDDIKFWLGNIKFNVYLCGLESKGRVNLLVRQYCNGPFRYPLDIYVNQYTLQCREKIACYVKAIADELHSKIDEITMTSIDDRSATDRKLHMLGEFQWVLPKQNRPLDDYPFATIKRFENLRVQYIAFRLFGLDSDAWETPEAARDKLLTDCFFTLTGTLENPEFYV